MRKIIYYVHISVDGFIEGPNGEFDWPAIGPELSAYSIDMNDEIDTFLYGRVVYLGMAGYWPTADEVSDDPHDKAFAPIWRRTPKVVASRTLTSADWNTRVIGDDLAAQVTALKAEPGKDILLTGGASLAASLTALGLVDDYRVVVHPVVLGGGKPVFPSPEQRVGLDLVGSRTFDGRTVLLHYRPAA